MGFIGMVKSDKTGESEGANRPLASEDELSGANIPSPWVWDMLLQGSSLQKAAHDAKDWDEAITFATRLVHGAPKDLQAVAKHNLAAVYSKRGEAAHTAESNAAAIANFSKAIELCPSEGRDYYWRGLCYSCNGNYDKAAVDFMKACELNPEYKDYQKALASANEKAAQIAGSAEEWAECGKAFFAVGDEDKAILAYAKAVELDPSNSLYKKTLADAYFSRGVRFKFLDDDYEAAAADYAKACELDPENKPDRPELWRDTVPSLGGRLRLI
ncbi:MAG: tetratricopeptide repeat protein [Spirochaetaceae bacterium]|jgi:tetratricopeptide (TPR) repeat protein|nr:tetratricopeptide repeat protein [Spirochaetaceae bacterium]